MGHPFTQVEVGQAQAWNNNSIVAPKRPQKDRWQLPFRYCPPHDASPRKGFEKLQGKLAKYQAAKTLTPFQLLNNNILFLRVSETHWDCGKMHYDFAVWKALASLKQYVEVILCIELKQRYCEILESVPAVCAKLSWKFHQSLCGCSALAGNRQYITGLTIYYLDMTCFDGLHLKNCNLLAAFWDKISMFHLGQTEHCLARGDGPLCAQHRALISFIWCRAT